MIERTKYFIFHFLFLLLCLSATAQDTLPVLPKPSRHSINLELGGGSVFYSLGYENNFYFNGKIKNSIRIGIGYYPNFLSFEKMLLSIPINFNYSSGNRNTRLFYSVGINNQIDFNPYPNDKDIRKKIRMHDEDAQGYGYEPYFTPYLNFSLGAEFNTSYWFTIRTYGTGLFTYRFIPDSYFIVAPLIGIAFCVKI
ncbi:MAG: hypothetical protein QY303_11245 [Vicingaceae bacterium]|nr:MAG: hypothetical protein QY303_11245 [Vicingaceae bacterium]